MNLLSNLKSGMKSLFEKPRVDRELEEELESYERASAADKQRSGMTPEAARRAARAEIGSRGAVKHRVWSSRWEAAVDNLLQDGKLAFRSLAKSPGFTFIALLSLTLGIGANTAIFTLFHAILLRPLPVQHPEQLVLFGDGQASGLTLGLPGGSTRLYSYFEFKEFAAKSQEFSGVAAVSSYQYENRMTFANGPLEKVQIDLVSGSYFHVLGVPAVLGRTIGMSDDQAPGGGPVAVASYGWFQRHANGDPAALGKVIHIGAHDYTLIGVAKPGFFGITVGKSTDLWIPISMEREIAPDRNGINNKWFQNLDILARMKPGVSFQQATASTNVLFQQMLHSDYLGAQPSQKDLTSVQHARVELTSAARGTASIRNLFALPLRILMAIVGLVLLIACANIANMLLARGVSRGREVAVRMALGASRGRIVLQLLTESAMLAVTGAVLGVALAWRASAMLLHMATPGPTPIPIDVTPDLPVLAFTLLLTICTVVLFGILPALRATRIESHGSLTPALRDGRGSAPTRNNLARGLIVGQIALSVLLLTAAGLFLRSLVKLTSIDTGFDKHNALVFFLDSSAANLPHDAEQAQSVRMQEQIEQQVKAIPGVQSDSFSFVSFNAGNWTDAVTFQGLPPTAGNRQEVYFNNVGNGFFAAMGIPVVGGRTFSAQDTFHSPKVAVINETMAHRFFPTGSAIGRHFGFGDDPAHSGDIEVIGVVKDAKHNELGEDAEMGAYFPCTQNPGFYGDFIVRYSGDPEPIVAATRRIVASANANILVDNVTSLSQLVDDSIATPTLISRLSAFFGALAVFLACIGIYGLLSYSVLRRTNEIGIRLALGAQSRTLLWMVLRESVVLLVVGLAVGLPVAIGATRVLRDLLYQLSPNDPWTFAGSAVAIAGMTLVAAWVPARRATRVDPMVALRCD
jgi:predicted permease